MAQRKSPSKKATVERITVAKRGRKPGPQQVTVERFAALDTVFAGPSITLEIENENTGEVSTVTAHKVTPGSIGAPEGYTGLPMLVSAWAKDRGHSVKLLAGTYIVAK